MKINFKKGLKRIYIVLLCILVIPFFIWYFASGGIFNNHKFASNIKIIENNNTISIFDFLEPLHQEAIKNTNLSLLSLSIFDLKCKPYQQKCTILSIDKEIKNNHSYTLEVGNIKKSFSVKMPSKFTYFWWQVWDFIKILLGFWVAYALYLIAEIIISWIINGFKND